MEIKVPCHKEPREPKEHEEVRWFIDGPTEPVLLTEPEVVWVFEGLDPGIVPLLGFRHLLGFDTNPPFGPFDHARFTAASIHAGFREFPATREHTCTLALVQWGAEGSTVLTHRMHQLWIQAPEKLVIKVHWRRGDLEPSVEPQAATVGARAQVEWQLDVPDDVFTTLDFQDWEPKEPGHPRPRGPFSELHGHRADGAYRLTGWTDDHKASYQYKVSVYDRKTNELITNHDPQLDNNGIPPG